MIMDEEYYARGLRDGGGVVDVVSTVVGPLQLAATPTGAQATATPTGARATATPIGAEVEVT